MRRLPRFAAMLLLIGPLFAGAAAADDSLIEAATPRPGDRTLGKADAPVTIVEYASLTCPHCAAFHKDTLPALKQKWIDTGKVRLIYRDFPLDRGALAAAVVARCIASPEKSFEFTGVLFETQREWAMASDFLAVLAKKAEPFGLDAAAFKRCVEDDKDANIRPVVEIAVEAEQKFKVDATPSFIVGKERISGGLTPDEFDKVLQPLTK